MSSITAVARPPVAVLTVQLMESVEPAPVVAKPKGQRLHSEDPLRGWNVPATHGAHESLPTALAKKPERHCAQASWPGESWNEPSGQALQLAAPCAEYVPALHFKHTVDVTAPTVTDQVPAGQGA